MRILFVSHSPLLYGAQLSLYELVSGLKSAGLAESVVCFPREGPLSRRLRDLGIPVKILSYSPWASGPMPFHRKVRSLGRNALAVRQFRRLMDSTAPDLVVTNTATVPSAAIAAFSKRLPHLWYVHEYGEPGYDVAFHWGRGITWRVVGRFSRRVVVPSRGLKSHLSKWISEDRLSIVRFSADTSGASADAISRDAGRPFGLVVIGHKVEGKGQEDAVRALAILRRSGIAAALTLVGSEKSDYGALLRQIVKTLHIEDSVTFVDHVEDPLTFVRDADVALICSRREALPRVVVEAMKCGRPVVGARAGGTVELIRDGWNGLLYEPGNADDLARRIEVLVEDRDFAALLARTAQAWAQSKFTIENYVEAFAAVASEVVGEASR